MGELFEREALTSLAAIPVRVDSEVVALLIVASHEKATIPDNIRGAIETIATHIGAIVSRVRLGETIKAQGELLQEANAALRVLLKQREWDRKELEDSLMNNVKHLVLPYVEKLKEADWLLTRGSFWKSSNLTWWKSLPPLCTRSQPRCSGSTPTEIRVADLIRQDKSSKEIADLLGISEWAVVFHRRGIRKKLGWPEETQPADLFGHPAVVVVVYLQLTCRPFIFFYGSPGGIFTLRAKTLANRSSCPALDLAGPSINWVCIIRQQPAHRGRIINHVGRSGKMVQ